MNVLGGSRVCAALIAVVAAQPALAAAPTSVFPGLHTPRLAPPPQAGSETILSNFIHNSNADTGIAESAGTFTPVDSQLVVCPKLPGTCTITVEADVQASGGANASNQWAICAVVDGAYVNACPFTGELLPDGTYGYGHTQQSLSVAPGKHTVVVQVYSFYGATVGYYQTHYAEYKP